MQRCPAVPKECVRRSCRTCRRGAGARARTARARARRRRSRDTGSGPRASHGTTTRSISLAPVDVAAGAEAAERQVLRDAEEEVVGPRHRRRRVVLGDRAAHRDAAPRPQRRQRRREVVVADVVEVHVDAVRRGLAQQLRQRPALVVEGCVDPELVAEVRHLLGRPGARDDAVAAELRHLRDEHPDGARGRGDPDESPSRSSATWKRPTYAVRPEPPRTPRYACAARRSASIRRSVPTPPSASRPASTTA